MLEAQGVSEGLGAPRLRLLSPRRGVEEALLEDLLLHAQLGLPRHNTTMVMVVVMVQRGQ